MKFFHKIRKSLIPGPKLTKYLLYAIGEILLVVIGILIALEANNLNEQNKAKQQSKLLLEDMVDDLAADTSYMFKMLPELEQKLLAESWLINQKQITKNQIDSLSKAVTPISWRFNINRRSFENIQSNQSIKLAGYEDLYKEISNYYITTHNRIESNKQLEQNSQLKESHFDKIIKQNLITSTQQYKDYEGFKVDYTAEEIPLTGELDVISSSLKQIETKNVLYEEYTRHNYIYISYVFCNSEAKKLIHKIKEILEL